MLRRFITTTVSATLTAAADDNAMTIILVTSGSPLPEADAGEGGGMMSMRGASERLP